jgi:hypothetical protein
VRLLGRTLLQNNSKLITLQNTWAYCGPKIIKKIKWDRVGKQCVFSLAHVDYSQRLKACGQRKKSLAMSKNPDTSIIITYPIN